MNIVAYFTENTLAKTGLSPTITIVNVATDTVIVSSAVMTELVNAPGWYKYNFAAFDSTLDYIHIVDAESDSVDDRYPTSSSGAADIAETVMRYER